MGGIFLFLCLLGLVVQYTIRNIDISRLLSSRFLQNQISKQSGNTEGDIFALLPRALGFDTPKTYLILFLNNTELRPGGGFIGVYATMRVDKGGMEVLALEGTEILDNRSSKEGVPAPPDPLLQYLNVKGWYFRDSNWSPDFFESSKQALSLYGRENGVASTTIDAVIGVTATVLEELMKKIGSLTIDGITFTPDNVIAELEHEVEYKFEERGIARSERKEIIQPLMHAIVEKLKNDVLLHPFEYRALAEQLVEQKHIVVYATDPVVQDALNNHAIGGRVRNTDGDYLLWSDANLGALKTDHAINRTLTYSLAPISENGRTYYEATATMTYEHTHDFDWRTSRYLVYARVFVPQGSQLVRTEGSTKGGIQSGQELGKQWFGTFVSVAPLTTHSLSFTYRLPESIREQIDSKLYTLLVQKQIGLVDASLTLNLDFDTTIESADPAEIQEEWGNDGYVIEMPFVHDVNFDVELK